MALPGAAAEVGEGESPRGPEPGLVLLVDDEPLLLSLIHI